MIKLFYIFSIFIICSKPVIAYPLHYQVVYDGHPTQSMRIEVNPIQYESKNAIELVGHIYGDLVDEKNTSIITTDFKFLETHQKTRNQILNQSFDWKLKAEGFFLSGYYSRKTPFQRQFKTQTFNVKTPSNFQTLQSLIYKLSQQPIYESDQYQDLIITPDHRIVPLTLSVLSTEPILVNQSMIDTYKIKIKVNKSWGFLIPSSTIWIRKAFPHVLVKYQKPGESAILIEKPKQDEIYK